MKVVGVVIALFAILAAAFGIYKATTLFDLGGTAMQQVENASEVVQDTLQKGKTLGEQKIDQGKQIIASGAANMIVSGQMLVDQKKKEAEQFLLQQKEQLKAEAQKKLEEEAKKQIQAIFTGR